MEKGGNQGKCVTKRGDLERVPDILLSGTQRTCETSRKRQRSVLTIAGSCFYPRRSSFNRINFGAMCLPAESALRDPWAFYGLQNLPSHLSSWNGNSVPTMQMPLQTDAAFSLYSPAHQLSPPLNLVFREIWSPLLSGFQHLMPWTKDYPECLKPNPFLFGGYTFEKRKSITQQK